jgi:ABC-type Zn uptake system ZnuABC Zn-binding protein ZnuA
VKGEGVKAILVESYYDTRSAEVVARHAGARVVVIPGDVGGFKDERGALDPRDWFAYEDTLVRLVVQAVK